MNKMNAGGNLEILGDGEGPGRYIMSINVNTERSVNLRKQIKQTTYHEMHHAFDASAAKFIKDEIAILSPQLKSFEDLLRLTVTVNKAELDNLAAIRKKFTNDVANPAENHVHIMQLKRFIKTSGEQTENTPDSERRAIYRFFKRFNKHPQYTKPNLQSNVKKELELYPELKIFYNDWITVFDNDNTRDKLLDILVNYGKGSQKVIKKNVKVTPKVAGAASEYLVNINDD